MKFYKETQFKKTEAGEIPDDWNAVRVQDLGRVITGTTPRTRIKDYWGGTFPFITPTDISEEGKYVYTTERTVTAKGIKKGKLIERDSVLVTCIGATLGKAALAIGQSITNQQINAVVCKEEIDPHYVYYMIKHRKTALRNLAGETAKPIVKKSLFEGFLVAMPKSHVEQQRIASVLSSVDETIEKTNVIIEKTQELKKGLMQKLLTKGMGHEEFKYSEELGCKIPKKWQVVVLGDQDKKVAGIIMGQSPPGKTYNEIGNGLPFLQGNAEFGDVYANPTVYTSKPIKIVEKDDILISVRAPVGEVNLSPFKCCIGRGLAAIRCNPQKLDFRFFFYYVKQAIYRLVVMATGSTFGAIKKENLSSFLVPLPPLSEQGEIASILSNLDDKIEKEKQTKEQLERLKKGLMQILLTGKVRIKVN